MSTHLDMRSTKRVNREIKFGETGLVCALVIGGWFAGEGIERLVHPQAHARIHRVAKAPAKHHLKIHHKKVFMPKNLQGSYISYFPLQSRPFNHYFQVASLVHVQRHLILQKVLVVKYHQRPFNRKNATLAHVLKSRKMHKAPKSLNTSSNMIANRLFYHSALPYLNDNCSASAQPDDIQRTKQGYIIKTKISSANGYYTNEHMAQFFGNRKPYWVTPNDTSIIKLFSQNDNEWLCNGFQYHKISTRRAKQLLKRAPATNGAFMNY